MNRLVRILVPVLAAAAIADGCAPGGAGRANDRGSAAAAIDRLVSSIYPNDQPGAVVLVMKDGQVLLRRAYGLANLELGVPLRPESVMPIASLSKAFTAAAILALAEKGRLSLHDDVTRFLTEYPARGAHITIEHLLTHTSGISSLADTADLRASSSQDAPVVDLLREWVRDLPPDAPPGRRWAYSNWGYALLAAIVERASGTGYAEFVRRTFLEPLGMSHTCYLDRRQVIPNRAAGYEASADGFANALPPRSRTVQPNGAAGWMSNVDDLARWSEGLTPGRVLTRASVQAMFTPYRLEDGSSTSYGYGWDLGEYAGHQIQEHQGGTIGFSAHIVRIPDARVLVVILSNRTSARVPLQATAHRAAALALGSPIPEPAAVSVDRRTLGGLVGQYRGADVGACSVGLDGDGLAVQVPGIGTIPLVPVGGTSFRSPLVTWSFQFETDAEGRGTRLRLRDWKLNDVAERFTPPPVVRRPVVAATRIELDACAGTYESLNGILVTVERTGDHLVVRPFGQQPLELFPLAPLVYATADATVEYGFIKGPAGEVVELQRSSGGTPIPARRIR